MSSSLADASVLGSTQNGDAMDSGENTLSFNDSDFYLNMDDVDIGPQIGQGAFSKVYLGRYLGELVAVKKQARRKADLEAYLMRELAVLKHFQHENLLQYVGASNAASAEPGGTGHVFIVTELACGGDLLALLLSDREVGWKLRVSILTDAARALEFLHRKSLIHRNIKSPKFLLDSQYRCKIADFGMARQLGANMTVVGTDAYMAPELMFDNPNGTSTDMFSFGIVSWETIYRQKAGADEFIERRMCDRFEVDIQTLQEEAPADTSIRLVAVAAQLVENEPDQRPTAEDTLVWLEELMDSLPDDAQAPRSPIDYEKLFPQEMGEHIRRPRSMVDGMDTENPSDSDVSLIKLAELLEEQGRYDDAESLLRRCLAVEEEKPGSGDLVAPLKKLADLQRKLGRYREAQMLLQRTLGIQEAEMGPQHPAVAVSLTNIGTLLRRQGRVEEAKTLLRRSLDIQEATLGPGHPDVALSLGKLGKILEGQGRYGEAEPLFRRCLDIQEATLGPKHGGVGASLIDLSELLRKQERFEEATELYERAMMVARETLGPRHPEYAAALSNAAEALVAQGEYQKAEHLFRQSLQIRKDTLGSLHPDVATSMTKLAGLLLSMRRYLDAQSLYERAIRIMEKVVGPDSPDVASLFTAWGELFAAQEKYSDAKLMFGRALRIDEGALGSKHYKVATDLQNLARVSESQGRVRDAKSRFERAHSILKRVLGPHHPDVDASARDVARVRAALGLPDLSAEESPGSAFVHPTTSSRVSGETLELDLRARSTGKDGEDSHTVTGTEPLLESKAGPPTCSAGRGEESHGTTGEEALASVCPTADDVTMNPEERTRVDKMTVTGLHKAVVDGDGELAEELLVSRRSRPDDRGPGDMTPLHYAVQYDREDIVRLLFRLSADPDLRNSSGLSALHMASALPASNMVWLLLDWGADPGILDSRSMTPQQCNAVYDADVQRLLTAAGEDREVIVKRDGIRRGMERTAFESKRYGFRLHVQADSVQAHLAQGETAGPISVAPLQEELDFEGRRLKGMLQVHCLPTKRRFDAPLLFDFPVDGGKKGDPIIDKYGKIRYEVLMRECGSKRWVRDPESSIPLIVIQDERGRIFVRAQVRHFSLRSVWKVEKEVDFGLQRYRIQDIPRRQRQGHSSVIKNATDGVAIKAYAWRCAQWNAAVESVRMGGGVMEIEANLEVTGKISREVTSAARLPQGATILPGESHFFEVPHAGSVFSTRKVAISIATESRTEDGDNTRMEAQMFLRRSKMLTVTLPVDGNGNVAGNPIASESGGVMHQIMRVIQNEVNSGPRSPRSSRINAEAASNTAPYSNVDDEANASERSGEEDVFVVSLASLAITETDAAQKTPPRERKPQPLAISRVGLFVFGWGCIGLGSALGWVLFVGGRERH